MVDSQYGTSGQGLDLPGAIYVKRQSFAIGRGGPEFTLMSLPPAAAIDVYMQYRIPGQQGSTAFGATVDFGTYLMYANNGSFAYPVLTRTPSSDDVNQLDPNGRLFSIRDFPASSWDLRVAPHAASSATVFVDVVAIGWAREPTGFGPAAVTTSSGKRSVEFPVGMPIVGFKDAADESSSGPFFARIFAADYLKPRNTPLSPGFVDAAEQLGFQNVLLCALRDDDGILSAFTPADKQTSVLRMDANRRLCVNVEAGTVTLSGPVTISGTVTLTPWSTTFTTALAASLLVKAAAGTLRSVSGRIDSTAATGTYYVQIFNLAAVPADATAITTGNSLCAPVKVQHLTGTDTRWEADFGEGGATASAGIAVVLSTTEFTKTIATNLMTASAEYR